VSAARESAGAADAKEGMPGRLLGGVALLLWAAAAAAFLPPRPAVHRARRAAAVRASPLEDIELTRLFGRLAEKRLLLDVPMAGTAELRNCCHGVGGSALSPLASRMADLIRRSLLPSHAPGLR